MIKITWQQYHEYLYTQLSIWGRWGYTFLKTGLRIYFFEKPPGIFHFVTLPLEITDKTKLTPWIFHKIVLDPLEIPRPKRKTPGNSTFFFLVIRGNSASFLTNPWKFHTLNSPPPPFVWIFSGITHWWYWAFLKLIVTSWEYNSKMLLAT